MDCTFCLDCVHACPHDNVGIMSRIPAGELMMDPRRSGIGFFSRRMDIGALALLFTFGALVNALGMVSPVYALEKWVGKLLRVESEAPVLAVIFVFCLVVEPVLLVGMAAWITRWWGGSRRALLPLAVRYSYGLVPIGFAIWLAHYGFHFLTGLFTFIPVAQSAARGIFGQPRWDLTGLPRGLAQPMEMGFLALGLAGSMLVCFRLAQEDVPDRALRAFAPWAALCVLLFVGAVWLMLQPMEMRGTLLGLGG